MKALLETLHNRGNQKQQLHECSLLLLASCPAIVGSPWRLARVPGKVDGMELLMEF